MKTRSTLLALALLGASLLACGDDGGGGGTDDAGQRDVQREVPDVTSDSGSPDVLVDDAFTRPEVAEDVTDASDADDAAVDDADAAADVEVGFDTPPLPDVDSTLALSVVEAGRDAIEDYCACDRCVSSGFRDEIDCRTNALGGGFELNDCKVDVIEDLGLQAESYLRCMKAAFDNARDCTPECSASECLACDSSFGRAWSACQSEFPTPYASLRACDEQ